MPTMQDTGFDYQAADDAQQARLRGEVYYGKPSAPEAMAHDDALRVVRAKAIEAAGRLPTITGDCDTPTRARRFVIHGFTVELTAAESAAIAAKVVAAQRALDALIELTHTLQK